MNEKIMKIQDEKGIFTVIPTDLSKSVDCISHDHLLIKLDAYVWRKGRV